MSYAFRKDLQGYRACNGPEDVGPDETYSEFEPVIVPDANVQKINILSTARANRELLIGRLTWLKTECDDALRAAQEAENEPAILLQTANMTAIKTAINSLVNAFDDPRVVNSINGGAKQAILLVYTEIVQAFKVAAPGPHARFKKLDTL